MAIFASNSSIDKISCKLNSVIRDGSILVYDKKQRAFVDAMPDNAIAVSGARNLTGNNTHTIYSGNNGGILEFKSLSGGSGIVLTHTNDEIVISSNISAENLSVPGDYNITINNGNTNATSKFEIFTCSPNSVQPLFISPSIIFPIELDDIITGNDNGYGFFYSPTIDFVSAGFKTGMMIMVSNASNQSGVWEIHHVSSHYIYTTNFSGDFGFNMGGPKPGVAIQQIDLTVSNQIISSYSVNFEERHITRGMIVHITGSDVIDGVYHIEDVIGHKLVISQETPLDYNGAIVSSCVTISADDTIVSTGFSVDNNGNVISNNIHAKKMSVSGEPINDGDVVRKIDLENVEMKTNKSKMFYFANIG